MYVGILRSSAGWMFGTASCCESIQDKLDEDFDQGDLL